MAATVGSVVLASGTAAAGRMSSFADYDQRYYAVTSAAELIKGEIEKAETVIEIKRTKTLVTVLVTENECDDEGNVIGTITVDMSPPTDNPKYSDPQFSSDTPSTTGSKINSIINRSIKAAMKTSLEEFDGSVWKENGEEIKSALNLSGSEETAADLAANLTFKVDEGTLYVTVEKDGYEVHIDTAASINDPSKPSEETKTETETVGNTTTITETTTYTRKILISWEAEIKK